MGDAPQEGGYIKLWRSLMENGHLHMPATAFKIFIFLMLRVNKKPGAGCKRGEGWVTYEDIREKCSEEGSNMPNSTIKRALDYLESRGYIERERTGKRGAQKVRLVTYGKHQDQYRNDTSEGVTGIATGIVTIPKQEIREKKKEELLLIPWVRFYEDKFALWPSQMELGDMQKLQARGVTDDLIIALLEEALADDDVDRPLPWAAKRISNMLPRGVRTREDYEKRKAEKKKAAEPKPTPVPVAYEEDEVTRKLRELMSGE